MISPERGFIPEEEIKQPEVAEESQETPQDYADEMRNQMQEGKNDIKTLIGQLDLVNVAMETEEDPQEWKKLNSRAAEIVGKLGEARRKINDANIALETTIELGVELPKAKEKVVEFNIPVDDLEDKRNETLESVADVSAMKELTTQSEKIFEELKEAGRAKNEEEFERLTKIYLMLNEDIKELAKVKTDKAKKIETLTEIKKIAA